MFKKGFKNEKGQGLLEFALVIPVFLALVLFIMEVGWISYNKILFDYAVRNNVWTVKMDEDRQASQSKRSMWVSTDRAWYYIYETFKKEIQENKSPINLDNVVVKRPQIMIHVGNKQQSYKTVRMERGVDYYGRPRLREGKDVINFASSIVEMTAELSYKIECLTPIGRSILGDGITVKQDLDKVRRGFMTGNNTDI